MSEGSGQGPWGCSYPHPPTRLCLLPPETGPSFHKCFTLREFVKTHRDGDRKCRVWGSVLSPWSTEGPVVSRSDTRHPTVPVEVGTRYQNPKVGVGPETILALLFPFSMFQDRGIFSFPFRRSLFNIPHPPTEYGEDAGEGAPPPLFSLYTHFFFHPTRRLTPPAANTAPVATRVFSHSPNTHTRARARIYFKSRVPHGLWDRSSADGVETRLRGWAKALSGPGNRTQRSRRGREGEERWLGGKWTRGGAQVCRRRRRRRGVAGAWTRGCPVCYEPTRRAAPRFSAPGTGRTPTPPLHTCAH